MRKSLLTLLPIVTAVAMLLIMDSPALANPPFPDGNERPVAVPAPQDVGPRPTVRRPKPIDQPNLKDYLRNRKRQELMEAGQTAEAKALELVGTDRVLVILVEFAGTDVFTWEAGVSTWDPLGIADPDEAVYNDEGNLIVGDCSNIITQTTVFTYTGPAHNEIPRPISPGDPSADSIWAEDFSPGWFEGFMFGQGVVFNYTMRDGTPVFDDFTGQSVADYYDDMSNGSYAITGDVIGWVQLPHSTWWYGADECPGRRSPYDPRIAFSGAIPGAGDSRTLVKDALDAVNAISDTLSWDFNWADYDLDGDDIIDRLWIVHAGYGEEDSTVLLNRTDYGEAALWSHSWSLSPPYQVAPGISAGPYIMMPENGGIGVFAHEYGHNLGADDLYAYGYGETSAGFWTLMADDWTGYPIGFEPPAMDPWHLDNWGWLDPLVITDPTQVYEVTLGQASRFPGGENVYRGVKIVLPYGIMGLPVPVWEGDSYWWSGRENLSNAMMTFTHNFYLQWRNVGENGGYDSALGDSRWRFGPANTGLLVWYNNNYYSNNEIFGYLQDSYGFGPKGRMLVIDSHPHPYRDPSVEPSWQGREHSNVTTRSLMRDAPFTLEDTVDFTMTEPYVVTTTQFAGQPAVSSFHDSMGYYPGVADEGDGTYWSTVDWDSSAAVPARKHYSIAAAPDYPGYHIQYIEGFGWRGFWGWGPPGSGNPGDEDVQYGWHVALIEEAEDHTWAKIRIWNSRKELDVSFEVDATEAGIGDELTYTCTIGKNIGTVMDALAVITLDTRKVKYVPNSAFGGAAPMSCGVSAEELAELHASGERRAVRELASSDSADVCSIVWAKYLGTGMGADPFGFSVEVKIGGDIDMAAHFFEQGELLQVEEADTVTVSANIYLPLVFKSYTSITSMSRANIWSIWPVLMATSVSNSLP